MILLLQFSTKLPAIRKKLDGIENGNWVAVTGELRSSTGTEPSTTFWASKIEKIVEVNCAKDGEQFSQVYEEYPEHCCEGLTEWNSGFDTSISIADECYETGLLAGSPVGTCINCGNGICEDIENPCNCLGDCEGKDKSDYFSIEEFCQSEDWNQTFSEACEEIIKDFPICELCQK